MASVRVFSCYFLIRALALYVCLWQAASTSALDEQIARAERLRAEAAEREAAEKVAATERAAAAAAEDERRRRLAAMHVSMQVKRIDAAQSDFF